MLIVAVASVGCKGLVGKLGIVELIIAVRTKRRGERQTSPPTIWQSCEKRSCFGGKRCPSVRTFKDGISKTQDKRSHYKGHSWITIRQMPPRFDLPPQTTQYPQSRRQSHKKSLASSRATPHSLPQSQQWSTLRPPHEEVQHNQEEYHPLKRKVTSDHSQNVSDAAFAQSFSSLAPPQASQVLVCRPTELWLLYCK